MNDNRRSHEASSLRTFFDEQLRHLQELVDELLSHVRYEPGTDQENQIIENFVDSANSKVRAAHGYAHKLRHHVCALHAHVLQVADQIPDPVALSPESFRSNPLVNALFVSTADIDRLFKNNLDVRAYLRTNSLHQAPIVFALLTACKSEKTMLGVGMQGDMLVRDVPHEAVNFASHRIHTPCESRAELNAALKKYLFDRVVHLIKQELAARTAAKSLIPGDNPYESRVNSLANPDIYLHALIEFIGSPALLLSIEKTHLKLNKLGIKSDGGDEQCTNEFDIHEIIWSDNSRDVVVRVAYPRPDISQ